MAAVAALLVSANAFSSGFQVMTHGARASGMGLAYAGISGDPTSVFYNPAGIAWMNHFEGYLGVNFLTRTEGELAGAAPFPGSGALETMENNWYFFPDGYLVLPLTNELNVGVGGFAQYGLGLKWDNPNTTFTGQFISQNSVIQAMDTNLNFTYRLFPELAIAAGVDYRFSKVQLERNRPAINPFTQSVVDVAHIKLDSEMTDNTGWGWNAGLMWKPVGMVSVGAAYRSSIEIDYEGQGTFTQRLTGNPAFDAAVAAQLPQGEQDVAVTIEFPASANLGVAFNLPGDFTLSLDADWTEWSSFSELFIDFENAAIPDLDRINNWEDSWAYRVGLEKRFGNFAVRAGYYKDESPQPIADVGPILADSDRNAYSLGFGYNTERWGVDISDIYIDFDHRDTRGEVNTDQFFGVYSEAANLIAINLRLSF